MQAVADLTAIKLVLGDREGNPARSGTKLKLPLINAALALERVSLAIEVLRN
jgi:hypothetical protein